MIVAEPARGRLDVELVQRGLARSRARATELIKNGQVSVDGVVTVKPATEVRAAAELAVDVAPEADFVSRGGVKLQGALDHFSQLAVAGRRCLDAGASTGGFTEVLLRRGAAEVVAVDVGTDQLAATLRADPRVRSLENRTVRHLTPDEIGGAVDLTVCDLSFISLRLVLDALVGCTRPDGDVIVMVKPQFEVGRDRLGPGGVVRNPRHRAGAVTAVADTAHALGWGTRGVARSVLPGPAGNVEFFLWLRTDAAPPDEASITATALAADAGAS